MKKIFTVMILFLCAVMFISTANAASKKPAKTPDFAGSPAWMKMDLRLREAWKEADTDRTNATRFECIMKTSHPMSADEKAILKDKGFEYRVVVGDIVTGAVLARNLPKVAGLSFVKIIELSAPMNLK